MIRLSDNAQNTSTYHESKLLMNPSFSHVFRSQLFVFDRLTVNCFEDSKHIFLFNINIEDAM